LVKLFFARLASKEKVVPQPLILPLNYRSRNITKSNQGILKSLWKSLGY